jgi:hypothetical protein
MDLITRELIKAYNLKKIGLDFMGYQIDKLENVSYHHLIIPARKKGKRTFENGVILMQGQGYNDSNSHDYLHLIENIEPEIFYYITSEMIDQKIKGKLDIENLKRIHELLRYFESKHLHDRGNKGKRLIKEKYLMRPKLDTI